jgi:hypothetical protein
MIDTEVGAEAGTPGVRERTGDGERPVPVR